MLAGQGFEEVYNLSGGIKAWQGLRAAGPAEIGMALVTGMETPAEVIKIAYGMEEGLRGFYTEMASKITDGDASRLLRHLADVEIKHKTRLFELHRSLEPGVADQEVFEKQLIAGVMEGGMTTEAFLEANRPALETVEDILNVAMTLEAQSLDLYLRYARKMERKDAEEVLTSLADEEKAHLSALGDMLDTAARKG
jgi:rubrerythrin